MSELVTTFQEDFDEMHARLASMGAAEHPLSGDIRREDGERAVRAIFAIAVEPPTVTQIIESRHANMTATYTRLSVAEDDTPVVETGRYTYELPEGAQAIYDAVTEPAKMRIGHPQGEVAEAFFDGIYENAMAFEPDSAN